MKYIIAFILIGFSSVSLQASELPLSAGDTVKFSLLGNPDLTTETVISDNGVIDLPLIGEIKISDLMQSEAKKKVENSYIKGGFFRNAEVSLRVINSVNNQVVLLGSSAKPGKYPIKPGLNTILDLISVTGGLNQNASKEIVLIRKVDSKVSRVVIDIEELILKGNESDFEDSNLKLQPNDLIYVKEQPVFYTFGELKSNSVFPYKKGLLVSQAISMAGGVTEMADDDVIIKRVDDNGNYQNIDVNLNTELMENDILFIKESMF